MNGAPPASPVAPLAADSPRTSRSPWKAIVIAILVVIVATVGFFVFRSTTSGPADTARSEGTSYRIGVISAVPYFNAIYDGYKKRMAELGYVEGKNVSYDFVEVPNAVGNQDLIKKEFVDKGVDLIMAFPTEASLEAKEVTKGTGIPVVAGTILIEGNDYAASVDKPGANVTGVNYGGTGVAVKRLEVLHELIPDAKRIMVPYQPGYPTVAPEIAAMRQAADRMGIELVEAPFPDVPSLIAYFAKDDAEGMDVQGVVQIPDPFAVIPDTVNAVWEWAARKGVPIAGATVTDDATGPVAAYIPDNASMGVLAANLTDIVLSGVPAGTVPMVTADGILFLNTKAADRLGLRISGDLLGQAGHIVR